MEKDGKVFYGDGRNLFTETIIGIAKELILAYKYTRWVNLCPAGEPEYFLFTQDYDGSKKYVVCKIKINAYNANPFFDCEVTTSRLNRYKVVFRQRMFEVGIIGK